MSFLIGLSDYLVKESLRQYFAVTMFTDRLPFNRANLLPVIGKAAEVTHPEPNNLPFKFTYSPVRTSLPPPPSTTAGVRYKLIVEKRKQISQANDEIERKQSGVEMNTRLGHLTSFDLALAYHDFPSSKPVDLSKINMFNFLGLPQEEIYYIYNGTKNVQEPFTPNGMFLAQNCGFEVICCLREHGYKRTLGSMDINDLSEYAEGRDILHRTTGNPERGSLLVDVLKDGRYNKELAKFIERIKEVFKIQSFVTV